MSMVNRSDTWIILQELSDANALKTPAANTTTKLIRNLNQLSVNETANVEEFKNTNGQTKHSDEDYSLPTTAIVMDTDKAMVDYLSNYTKGKKFLEIAYLGIIGGKYQTNFKTGKHVAQGNRSRPGGVTSFPYSFNGFFPDAAVTFTATQMGLIATAAGVTISASPAALTISVAQGQRIDEKAVS